MFVKLFFFVTFSPHPISSLRPLIALLHGPVAVISLHQHNLRLNAFVESEGWPAVHSAQGAS
jgi:hypothetical protein